jgi:hypothetical protein
MRDGTLIRYAFPDGPVWHGHEVAEVEH